MAYSLTVDGRRGSGEDVGDNQYRCSWVELEGKLVEATGKTLGEVDAAHVFDLTRTNPKVTGIAGDVVEQSVIGYPANSDQEPDLVIDGVETELKTTGLRRSKKGKGFEAKEPMSITAVSLDAIAGEDFYSSNFWHKLEHMLIVYYLYDSETTVPAAEYANFPIEGYQLHEFDDEERETLRNDWTLVRDFVKRVQDEHESEEERRALYPKLSSALRRDLLLIDTAPKYPHPPRFRLKRSTVTAIARKNFGDGYEQLPKSYTSYESIDFELDTIAGRFLGRTLGEMAEELGVPFDPAKGNKNLAEMCLTRAFGVSGKMSGIELFAKIGLTPKSVVLTRRGARTEDMKLFTIDFEEFTPGADFEDSTFREYFANTQLLCMVFEEPSKDAPLTENKLLGYRRLAFDDGFIDSEVRRVWERIEHLIVDGELVDVVAYDRKTGKPKVNKTGVVSSAPNFPKSSEGDVFVRGTSSDSTRKPLCINGVRMYQQQVWVKGKYVAERIARENRG